MNQRQQLIDRKHQVIAEIRSARRALEAARLGGDRGSQRRTRQLEERLQALMAEERGLRLAIDRAERE